jgi:hypothetical protein
MRTYIYRNLYDFDLASAYPRNMGAYNILKTTIYGRIVNIFVDKDYGNGLSGRITVSTGTEFNQMLETIDTSIFEMGKKYFNLPTPSEIIDQIENRVNNRIKQQNMIEIE